MQKFYWGTKETLLPVYTSLAEAVAKHSDVDCVVNFASCRSVAKSTHDIFRFSDQIKTITLIAEAPFLLVVSASLPVGSIAELMPYARKTSVNLTYASWGVGTAGHLLGEMLKAFARIDAVHVPYKGGAPALTDLIGGQVSMMFSTPLMSGPHIRSGKVRALAVTGSARLAALPQVPTFAEAGFQRIELQAWFALLAPAKTPEDTIARLHKHVIAIAQSPEFTRSVTSEGGVVVASSPQDLAKRIASDSALVERVVRETSFKVEE